MARKEKERPKSFVDVASKYRKGKSEMPRWNVIPTNIYELDHQVLGCGGVPIGTMTGIAGQPSSGKSTLCLHIAKQTQGLGGSVDWDDIERTFDAAWAEKIGVSFEEEKWAFNDTAESAEHAYQRMLDFLGYADLVVLDSVAQMMPASELEKGIVDDKGEVQKEKVGVRALTNRRCLNMLVWGRKDDTNLRYSNTAIILVNQLTTNVMQKWGDKDTESGGSGVKFGCSIMIRMRRVSTKDGVTAFAVRNVKNKCALPYQRAEIFLDLEQNKFWPCNVEAWIEGAKSVPDLQISTGRGYVQIGETKLHGKREVANYLEQNRDLIPKVLGGPTTPVEESDDGT